MTSRGTSSRRSSSARTPDLSHDHRGPSPLRRWRAFVDRATDEPWFEGAARAGHVVSGIVHLLIAYVVVRIALGDGGNADQSGALATVSATTGGTIALVLAAVAFVAMALVVNVVGPFTRGVEMTTPWEALSKSVPY